MFIVVYPAVPAFTHCVNVFTSNARFVYADGRLKEKVLINEKRNVREEDASIPGREAHSMV